jgi:hypothetical protein
MLYREIIAVCSEINTKHVNTVCGQNVELLNVELAVKIVTSGAVSLGALTFTRILHDFNPCRTRNTALIHWKNQNINCIWRHNSVMAESHRTKQG